MVDQNLMEFSMDYFRVDGKVALITGANHGLGEAYAIALAKAGADIFIAHRSAEISRVTEEIESLGRRVEFLQGDLLDPDYRQAVIDTCMEKYGRIDILVNNAGVNIGHELIDFPDEEFTDVVAIQLLATQYFTRAVCKVMAKQGYGKIIMIGSALSFASDENSAAYCAAKHGILGLTKAYANEMGKYGIRCNCIAPGFFLTNITKKVIELNPKHYTLTTERMPLCLDGQWGNVRDLMGTCVYLASPASDYISGEVIAVDGGFKAVLC